MTVSLAGSLKESLSNLTSVHRLEALFSHLSYVAPAIRSW
jgi:hypothetical protein